MLPVVKEKGPAQAGVASTPAVIIAAAKLVRDLMSLLLIDAVVLKYRQHGFSIQMTRSSFREPGNSGVYWAGAAGGFQREGILVSFVSRAAVRVESTTNGSAGLESRSEAGMN